MNIAAITHFTSQNVSGKCPLRLTRSKVVSINASLWNDKIKNKTLCYAKLYFVSEFQTWLFHKFTLHLNLGPKKNINVQYCTRKPDSIYARMALQCGQTFCDTTRKIKRYFFMQQTFWKKIYIVFNSNVPKRCCIASTLQW